MKFKLTPDERKWVCYDVGNSAFTLLVSTIIPIYFNFLANREGLSAVDYMAYWGYAASIATLLVALSGPALGAFSDRKNRKRLLFAAAVLIGAAGCFFLGFVRHWISFLLIFVAARSAYSISLIFYDSMLTDISPKNRMDSVSSIGFAWGYIGSCVPFALSLALVLFSDSLGFSQILAMRLSLALTAGWWICFSLPLLSVYRKKNPQRAGGTRPVLQELLSSLKSIGKNKKILFFLLSFFFYIDGVYTIIDMATAYGSALGLDSAGLLLALLFTQIIAFPCSILAGRLSRAVSAEKLIIFCICAYFAISLFAAFMSSQLHFWILAAAVGAFQGGIQALSRSYFAKIIPQERSGGYFGIYDICGKGASFVGTAAVGAVSQLTGSANLGVLSLSAFFIAGLILFCLSAKADPGV